MPQKWTNSNSRYRIEWYKLLLINFYNSKTEPEQLSTFCTLQKLLKKSEDYNKENIVLGGDNNLIFDCKFDASGRNPILKRNIYRN